MDRQRFERLVAEAVDKLPDELRASMENVDVVVADRPEPGQLKELDKEHGETLLGLYEGIPLTRRSRHYGMVVPDKITIFQIPIEAICRNDAEVIKRVQRVVLHEIAHHFGISDARLKQLGMY